MRRAACPALLLVVALTFAPAIAGAAPAAELIADVDRDGAPDVLRIDAPGWLTMVSRSGATKVVMFGRSGPLTDARLSFAATPTPTVVASAQLGGAWEAIALAAGPSGLTELWRGPVGPAGDDDEYELVVEARPDGLWRFQTRADLRRCDGAAIELFPERWDPRARRFAPAAMPVPTPPAEAPTVTATPAALAPVAWFRPSATSRATGATDAGMLVAPRALADGDPATAWTAPGDGPWHLVALPDEPARRPRRRDPHRARGRQAPARRPAVGRGRERPRGDRDPAGPRRGLPGHLAGAPRGLRRDRAPRHPSRGAGGGGARAAGDRRRRARSAGGPRRADRSGGGRRARRRQRGPGARRPGRGRRGPALDGARERGARRAPPLACGGGGAADRGVLADPGRGGAHRRDRRRPPRGRGRAPGKPGARRPTSSWPRTWRAPATKTGNGRSSAPLAAAAPAALLAATGVGDRANPAGGGAGPGAAAPGRADRRGQTGATPEAQADRWRALGIAAAAAPVDQRGPARAALAVALASAGKSYELRYRTLAALAPIADDAAVAALAAYLDGLPDTAAGRALARIGARGLADNPSPRGPRDPGSARRRRRSRTPPRGDPRPERAARRRARHRPGPRRPGRGPRRRSLADDPTAGRDRPGRALRGAADAGRAHRRGRRRRRDRGPGRGGGRGGELRAATGSTRSCSAGSTTVGRCGRCATAPSRR
jgi:hypothetical protein